MDSSSLELAVFADNPEPRCPVVLVLDTSGSMRGAAINQLNEGLRAFSEALKADRLASLRVEVAVVAFGGDVRAVHVGGYEPVVSEQARARALAIRRPEKPIPFDAQHAFVTVDHFVPPALEANGETPLGEAIQRSLALLKERKEIYKRNGLDYFRPWMFVISDGKPTDKGWEAVAEQIKAEERRKSLLFYAVGVEKADMQVLGRFTETRAPLKLKSLAFDELFQWLSKSLSVIAHSRPGEQAPLPPVGWGSVDTSHS